MYQPDLESPRGGQAEPTAKPDWKRDAKARLRDWKAADEAKEEKRTGDFDFIKVYPRGWERLKFLIGEYPLAAKLYAFLAQHIDAGIGAVVASQALLSEELGVSDKTIRKISKFLEDNNALIRIKIQGNLYAYALNPEEVWKSWRDYKKYAAFNTKTLARGADNPNIKRRLNFMLKNRKAAQDEPTLPDLELPEEGQ
jgi:hypothetical protein